VPGGGIRNREERVSSTNKYSASIDYLTQKKKKLKVKLVKHMLRQVWKEDGKSQKWGESEGDSSDGRLMKGLNMKKGPCQTKGNKGSSLGGKR